MMNRQAPYADANASQYAAAQMQHVSAQRMQQNVGMNSFPGRLDSFPAEHGQPYIPPRAEGQWPLPNPVSSNQYTEGQGGNAAHSFNQAQIPDPNVNIEKQANKESRLQSHEQDMEIGYEDKPSPLTFEGLEKKFLDEIMKLIKEQSDVEDAENARHREKILEINNQYQEKLSSLRARQASRREEFLQNEFQTRLLQLKQAELNHHQIRTDLREPHSYGEIAAAEGWQAFASGQLESYREQRPLIGGVRSQVIEGRVPFPAGRVYNNTGARYY